MKPETIRVTDEGYFQMPAELRFQEGIDERTYVLRVFSYILEHKIPRGKKLVAIEHPVGAPTRQGIATNIERVRSIVLRNWDNNEMGVAPFLFCLEVLDDMDPRQRELGFQIDRMFFEEEGLFHRVLLCGDRLTPGMMRAVEWAVAAGIRISCDSEAMERQLGAYMASS